MQKNDDGKIIGLAIVLGLVSMILGMFDYFYSSKIVESNFLKSNQVDGGGLITDRDEFYVLVDKKEYRVGRDVFSKLPKEGVANFLLSDFSHYIYQVEYQDSRFDSIQIYFTGLMVFMFLASTILYFMGSIIFGWIVGGVGVYFVSIASSIFVFN